MRACGMWRDNLHALTSQVFLRDDFDAILTNAAGMRLDAEGIRAAF